MNLPEHRIMQQHRIIARRYLRTAGFLIEHGFCTEAGEITWGALVHALNALARKRHRRNLGNNRARREFMEYMVGVGALKESDMDAFFSIGLSLHSHFYHPHMNDDALASDLGVARALTERLLAAA